MVHIANLSTDSIMGRQPYSYLAQFSIPYFEQTQLAPDTTLSYSARATDGVSPDMNIR